METITAGFIMGRCTPYMYLYSGKQVIQALGSAAGIYLNKDLAGLAVLVGFQLFMAEATIARKFANKQSCQFV